MALNISCTEDFKRHIESCAKKQKLKKYQKTATFVRALLAKETNYQPPKEEFDYLK